MNQTYVFITDSDSDLYYKIADERNIPVIKMPYALDGKEYPDENGREGEEKQAEFFGRMRAGICNRFFGIVYGNTFFVPKR